MLRAGFKQGKPTVVEYVQDILPHLRRCRSSKPDQVSFMLKRLNDEDFRMVVSTCTPDYELPDIETLSAHIVVRAKRMDAVLPMVMARARARLMCPSGDSHPFSCEYPYVRRSPQPS